MDEPADLPGEVADERLTVFTIGHSDHAAEELVALLHRYQIELVADVRSTPFSRYAPQANREALARGLTAAGIAYAWLGDRLGGKPGGTVADYGELRARPAFRHGITALLGLSRQKRTVVLCAEGDHRHCHRYKLITPALEESGAHVLHIQPDGSVVDEEAEPKQMALF